MTGVQGSERMKERERTIARRKRRVKVEGKIGITPRVDKTEFGGDRKARVIGSLFKRHLARRCPLAATLPCKILI